MEDLILGLTILGTVLIVLGFPVHLAYFIYQFVQARRNPLKKGPYWFPLIVHLLLVGIIIIIPNFLRFAAPAKQSEAKTNLGGIYVAQTAYFSQTNTYAGGPHAFEA